MKEYQYISILKVFVIYLIAFLPTWIVLLNKHTYSNKKTFLKRNCILIFAEIFLFFIIYFFPRNIVSIFSFEKNIQNYMIYSLKILFIVSSTTIIHYSIPLYFISKKNKIGFILFICKFLYIPFLIIGNIIFNTKGILFAVPICDLLFNIFLLYFYNKYKE